MISVQSCIWFRCVFSQKFKSGKLSSLKRISVPVGQNYLPFSHSLMSHWPHQSILLSLSVCVAHQKNDSSSVSGSDVESTSYSGTGLSTAGSLSLVHLLYDTPLQVKGNMHGIWTDLQKKANGSSGPSNTFGPRIEKSKIDQLLNRYLSIKQKQTKKPFSLQGCAITGCPTDQYPSLISISDFSDCPIKEQQVCNKNPNGLT